VPFTDAWCRSMSECAINKPQAGAQSSGRGCVCSPALSSRARLVFESVWSADDDCLYQPFLCFVVSPSIPVCGGAMAGAHFQVCDSKQKTTIEPFQDCVCSLGAAWVLRFWRATDARVCAKNCTAAARLVPCTPKNRHPLLFLVISRAHCGPLWRRLQGRLPPCTRLHTHPTDCLSVVEAARRLLTNRDRWLLQLHLGASSLRPLCVWLLTCTTTTRARGLGTHARLPPPLDEQPRQTRDLQAVVDCGRRGCSMCGFVLCVLLLRASSLRCLAHSPIRGCWPGTATSGLVLPLPPFSDDISLTLHLVCFLWGAAAAQGCLLTPRVALCWCSRLWV